MRMAPWLGRGTVVGLIAAGVALRVFGLNASPQIDGDEAWHAVQLVKWWRGEPYVLWTVTGLPLSPLHAALELPFLLVVGPATWWLRLPSLLTGLAALALTLPVGTQLMGRRAAWRATAVLAVLPVAIAASRIGYESSHAPLYGLIALALADRLRIGALAALLPASYAVHPSNVLLLPVTLAVVARRTIESHGTGPAARWRLARHTLILGIAALGTGVVTLLRPSVRFTSQLYDAGLSGPHDPILFLKRLAAIWLSQGEQPHPALVAGVWIGLLGLLVTTLPVLIRSQRWDVLTLVAGTALSGLGLFVMGGSNVVLWGMSRYSYVLIAPLALAVGGLLEGLIPVPSPISGGASRLRRWGSPLASGGLVAAALMLLWVGAPLRVPAAHFRHENGHEPGASPTALSPYDRVAGLLRAEAGGVRAGTAGRTPVVVEAINGPLIEWLLLDEPGLVTVHAPKFGTHPVAKAERGRQIVRRGGLIVTEPGEFFEQALSSTLPPGVLRRRSLDGPNGRRAIVLDLPEPGSERYWPLAADLDGDRRADRIAVDLTDGAWLVERSSDGSIVRLAAIEPTGEPFTLDFDGDGRLDRAVYQPDYARFVIESARGGRSEFVLGPPHSRPVVGDFDGDGRDEPAAFATIESVWYLPARSPLAFGPGQRFGGQPAPVPGDYDGDGRADLTVVDRNRATWLVQRSTAGDVAIDFGAPDWVPLPADYDGDGQLDLAMFDPTTATWWLRRSRLGPARFVVGPPGATPMPADFDADGRVDLATFEPRTGRWYVLPARSDLAVVALAPLHRASPTREPAIRTARIPGPADGTTVRGSTPGPVVRP